MRSRPFCCVRDGLILPARLLADLRFMGGSAFRGILSATGMSGEDRPRLSLFTAVTVWLEGRSSTFPVDKGGVSTALEWGLACAYNMESSAIVAADVGIDMFGVTMTPIPGAIATAVEAPDEVPRPKAQETILLIRGFPPSEVKGVEPVLKAVSSSCFFRQTALGFRFLSGKEIRG